MLDPRANSIEYQAQLELIKRVDKLIDRKRNGDSVKKLFPPLVRAARYLDVLALKADFEEDTVTDLTYIYECLAQTLKINRFPASPGVGLITTPIVTVGIPGPPGAAGSGNYLYFAWADDSSGTGFTTTFSALKPYMAFIQSPSPLLVLTVAQFTGRWFKVLGTDGTNGTNGTNGSDGSNGTNGIDGNTLMTGTVDPVNGQGADGDFYLNTTDWTIFGPKASGAWPAGVSIIGPQGPAGDDGNTILTGIGTPMPGLGNDGDIYLNLSNYDLYAPKTGGAWPAPVSLVGATGDTGATGATGTTGEDGEDGASVYIYIAYSDNAAGSGYILVSSNDDTATTTAFDSAKDWIAILTSPTQLGGLITASYFAGLWARYQGSGDRWTTSSTTTQTIGTGTFTFSVEQNLAYSVGQTVVVADPSDYTNRMEGFVTSYSPMTGNFVLDIVQNYGAGTFSTWAISLQSLTVDPPTTYGGPSPSTVVVNDLPIGTAILGMTYDQLFQHIYAPYVSPTFSAFAITGEALTKEVGDSVTGSKTITWTTTTPANVDDGIPGSIRLRDHTNATTLADSLADDSTEAGITFTTVTKTSPATHVWRLEGLNTNAVQFTRDVTVTWLWRKYNGTSANATLTEAQLEALVTSSLSATASATYTFAAGDYKYFAWPDSFTSPTAVTGFRDASTNLGVAMADVTDDASFSNTQNGWSYAIVSVTNSFGVTTNYRLYRTKNILGGTINIIVS